MYILYHNIANFSKVNGDNSVQLCKHTNGILFEGLNVLILISLKIIVLNAVAFVTVH